MEEIRKGAGGGLRHVTETEKVRPVMTSREELMGQIRSGITLQKVELNRRGDNSSTGIAGMLQKALRDRTIALCVSSSEEDNDADDVDDEWDE